MTALALVSLALTGAALIVAGRSTVLTVRQMCGTVAADRLVVGLNALGFALILVSVTAHQISTVIAAAIVIAVADFAPGRIVAITGGPDRICEFRRAFRQVFQILVEGPTSPDREARVSAAFEDLTRFKSPETDRVIEGVRVVLERRAQRAGPKSTDQASEELKAALAELS